MNQEMLTKTTAIYDKIYSRLMNTVTEQEAKEFATHYKVPVHVQED